jgi:hypothetical protein
MALPGRTTAIHGHPVELAGAMAHALHGAQFGAFDVPKRGGDRGQAYLSHPKILNFGI